MITYKNMVFDNIDKMSILDYLLKVVKTCCSTIDGANLRCKTSTQHKARCPEQGHSDRIPESQLKGPNIAQSIKLIAAIRNFARR